MDRRGFLRGALGTLSAAVGAFALGRGVDARETMPEGVQGRQVDATVSALPFSGGNWPPDTMTLVTGPDPGAYVYVELGFDGVMRVIPPGTPSPSQDGFAHGMGIPRAEFPEFDAKHGIVTLDRSIFFDPWEVRATRAAYLYALGQRQPDRPIDGNHLSVRFMPKTLYPVKVTLDGAEVREVNDSYDGPNGWLVQFIGVFGEKARYRILTGTVAHAVDGAAIWPGDYTAPLLP